VRNALTLLLGLPAEQGLDLADAIHFENRPRAGKFVSFDGAFVRRARRAGLADVGEVPGNKP